MINPELSKEHQVAMTLQALTSAAGVLHDMSLSPEYRDIMVDDLGQISDAAKAINLVWSRLRAREAA